MKRTSREYKIFMNSEKWRSIRNKRLEIDNYTCQCCGIHGNGNIYLEVHHLSYADFGGNEDVFKDLVSVCPSCHDKLHRLNERITEDLTENKPTRIF